MWPYFEIEFCRCNQNEVIGESRITGVFIKRDGGKQVKTETQREYHVMTKTETGPTTAVSQKMPRTNDHQPPGAREKQGKLLSRVSGEVWLLTL